METPQSSKDFADCPSYNGGQLLIPMRGGKWRVQNVLEKTAYHRGHGGTRSLAGKMSPRSEECQGMTSVVPSGFKKSSATVRRGSATSSTFRFLPDPI